MKMSVFLSPSPGPSRILYWATMGSSQGRVHDKREAGVPQGGAVTVSIRLTCLGSLVISAIHLIVIHSLFFSGLVLLQVPF